MVNLLKIESDVFNPVQFVLRISLVRLVTYRFLKFTIIYYYINVSH